MSVYSMIEVYMLEENDISQFVADVPTRPGRWTWDALWTPLVSADETAGRYSILEQLLAQKAGPPPHVHEHGDEVFYVLDGVLRVQLGESVFEARAGQLVRVPQGMTHAFAVTSKTARFLNFYSPALVDRMITMLSVPAQEPRLPTAAEQERATVQQETAYRDRLVELDSQLWVDQPDLLKRYRGEGGRPSSASGAR